MLVIIPETISSTSGIEMGKSQITNGKSQDVPAPGHRDVLALRFHPWGRAKDHGIYLENEQGCAKL
jgi:hypothetical protein